MTADLSARDRVFVHKARRAAEYALFFLLHVENVYQEVEDVPRGSPKRRRIVDDACTYVTFALEQVASLVYSVHVSREYLPAGIEAARVLGGQSMPPAPEPVAFWRDEIWERTNRMRPERDALWRAPAIEAGPVACDGEARTPGLKAVLACARGLTAALEKFLDLTRASGWEPRLVAFLAATRRAVGRRLTFCLGVGMALGLLLGVEAVRSLILNQGVSTLLPIGLSALPSLLFLPRPARRLKVDWGRRAFVSRHTAEPDPAIVRWPPGNPFTYRMPCETVFHLVLLVGSLVLIGGGLWLVSLHEKWTSFSTVYASLALVFVFLHLCVFLDRWDFLDERPVRLRALTVVAIGLALILAEWFVPLAVFLLATGVAITWPMWRRRAPRMLTTGAAALTLLAAASALNAAFSRTTNAWSDGMGVDERDPALRHVTVQAWPFGDVDQPVVVLAASGGGSRAAIYTAKTLLNLTRDLGHVASQLQAISSVSGGSLAAAAYIARLYAGRPIDDLEAAVSNDFLLPTLVGAFTPWSSRGAAIEESWRKAGDRVPAMGDLRMSHLALAWQRAQERHASTPPFPMPLFNTCALDGHDVVVTPLDRHLYTDASNERWRQLRSDYGLEPTAVPTWVVDRDAIYGLEDLLPNANVLMASAVRASANFPFGFPLVDVETCRESLFLSPIRDIATADAVRRTAASAKGAPMSACHGPATVHLTDGGVLSNSGMWSLFHLLSRPESVERLKGRGVLLVLVEASKMPEYTESHRSLLPLFGTIGDRKPVAQSLHRRMFELLHGLYGGRLAIVQLDLIPEVEPKSFNVYTTWALDPQSQRRLDQSFETVWAKAKIAIGARFAILRTGGDAGPDHLLRPPLD